MKLRKRISTWLSIRWKETCSPIGRCCENGVTLVCWSCMCVCFNTEFDWNVMCLFRRARCTRRGGGVEFVSASFVWLCCVLFVGLGAESMAWKCWCKGSISYRRVVKTSFTIGGHVWPTSCLPVFPSRSDSINLIDWSRTELVNLVRLSAAFTVR